MNLHEYTDKPMSVTDLFKETIFFCDNKKSAWKCAKSTFKDITKISNKWRTMKPHNEELISDLPDDNENELQK